MRRHVTAGVTALLLGSATTTQAQQPVDQPEPSTVPASVGAAIGLGAAGLLVGGLVGLGIASNCQGSYCQIPPILLGAEAGGAFGVALGAHLGNRGRGSLGLDCLVSAGVWGVGIVTLALSGGWEPPGTTIVAVAIPIAQVAATVLTEQLVGHARARQSTVSIVPDRHGGGALVLNLSF